MPNTHTQKTGRHGGQLLFQYLYGQERESLQRIFLVRQITVDNQ